MHTFGSDNGYSGQSVAFLPGAKPLVVNFGRSGNSTESVGTLDAFAPHTPRINITCNKDGALATRAPGAPTQVIVFPDAMQSYQ